MVQLDLEPKYMPNDRSDKEIEFYRTQILRISGTDTKKANHFHPVSLFEALSTLENVSYKYFKQVRDDAGSDLDFWVEKTLTRSLPFLQGAKGDFRSFNHFRGTYFERQILFHLGIDRHRLIMRQQGKHQLVDSFPSKEVRKRNLEGFQPPLLSREKVKDPLVDLFVNKQFLAGLNNPMGALRGDIFSCWEPSYFSALSPYKQRTLNLWLYFPSLTSYEIANVLKTEKLGEFPASSIRVWVKRALDRSMVLSAIKFDCFL